MTNDDILNQLRSRRDRIKELMPLQKILLATELLRSELNYVESLIEYRERHGGLNGIVLLPPNEKS
jgi:hypothetical protein